MLRNLEVEVTNLKRELKSKLSGSRVDQSVKNRTLHFNSGVNLRVVSSSPRLARCLVGSPLKTKQNNNNNKKVGYCSFPTVVNIDRVLKT